MSDFATSASPTGWRAAVVQDFARSELFERTFQEGMDLVEETAGYLDGAHYLKISCSSGERVRAPMRPIRSAARSPGSGVALD